jgi:hypothetical protein
MSRFDIFIVLAQEISRNDDTILVLIEGKVIMDISTSSAIQDSQWLDTYLLQKAQQAITQTLLQPVHQAQTQ